MLDLFTYDDWFYGDKLEISNMTDHCTPFKDCILYTECNRCLRPSVAFTIEWFPKQWPDSLKKMTCRFFFSRHFTLYNKI